MKGVANCEMLRGAVSKRRSVDTRMGQPNGRNGPLLRTEYIGARGLTRGSETSQYPEERKSTETPLVVASERGSAQTRGVTLWGCGLQRGPWKLDERSGKVGHSG
jgi:hypothetical protein